MLEPFLAHFSKHTSFGSYLGVTFGDKCQKKKTNMLCDREKLLVFFKSKKITFTWFGYLNTYPDYHFRTECTKRPGEERTVPADSNSSIFDRSKAVEETSTTQKMEVLVLYLSSGTFY